MVGAVFEKRPVVASRARSLIERFTSLCVTGVKVRTLLHAADFNGGHGGEVRTPVRATYTTLSASTNGNAACGVASKGQVGDASRMTNCATVLFTVGGGCTVIGPSM